MIRYTQYNWSVFLIEQLITPPSFNKRKIFPHKWLVNTWKWSAWCETCCEVEFAFTFLQLVPIIVSITAPRKAAYGVKTAPLRLALKTNHVLSQMPNGCMEPGCLHTGHTCGHRALVPPSRSLGILGGNKHTNSLLKVVLWDSGSAPSVSLHKREDNDHAAEFMALLQGPPLPLVYWPVSWYLFYIVDSGVKSVWGKIQISQESPTEDKKKKRKMSSFYLVSVPFAQKQVMLTHRGNLFSSLHSWENVHLHKQKVFSIWVTFPPTFINISKPQLAESMRWRTIACAITFMTW